MHARRLALWLVPFALGAATARAEDAALTVVAADVARALAVVEERTVPIDNDGSVDAAPRCANAFLGGRGLRHVVVRGAQIVEDVELVGFPAEGPCPTAATLEGARKAARAATAAAQRVRFDDPALRVSPVTADASAPVRVEELVLDNEKERTSRVVRTVRSDRAALAASVDGGGISSFDALTVSSWLVGADGASTRLLVERVHHRAGGKDWSALRVRGPLRVPDNGVDVAALATALSADARRCTVSVVANAALIDTVAVTVASAAVPAGAARAPVSAAKAERATSVVYAKAGAGCDDAARRLAAALPGGATVEALTWASQAPLVIALGTAATPRAP
jgi:hypothetical protein